MHKTQFALLGLLTVLLFSSCTKVLNDELPENKPKLVVNGFINTDSTLKVNISKTVHVFANENTNNLPFIAGATTKFYENGVLLFSLQEDENGYYTKPGFYPSQGRIYKIEVEKEGYPSVNAETDIPSPVSIQSFDTTLVSDNENGGGYFYGEEIRCKLKYIDPAGTTNYYRLDCYLHYEDEEGNEYLNRQYVYVNENDEHLFDKVYGYLLWTDLLTQGGETEINFKIYPDGYYDEGNPNNSVSISYIVMLSSVSEDYYKYDKTRSIFYETGGSADPFSEPVLIHTNIKDGFGIFGGISNDTVSFQYPLSY
jgi:hypothetical protein